MDNNITTKDFKSRLESYGIPTQEEPLELYGDGIEFIFYFNPEPWNFFPRVEISRDNELIYISEYTVENTLSNLDRKIYNEVTERNLLGAISNSLELTGKIIRFFDRMEIDNFSTARMDQKLERIFEKYKFND